MYYKYKCGEETIRVWLWNDDIHTNVDVTDYNNNTEFPRSIRVDDNGSFFTWNRNKIYLNDWIRTSMKEIQSKVDNGEHITADMLCQAIMSDGIDNVQFIVPLNTTNFRCPFCLNGNEFKNVLCKVVEDDYRKVKDNYKIKVVPIIPDDSVANSREFYTVDMASLIKNGIIKIVL